MKKPVSKTTKWLYLFIGIAVICMTGCKKDPDDPDGGSKEPVWTYDTKENPYGSKPAISGNKLIVCSREDDIDSGTVHCLNLSDGTILWKMTDSTVVRNNPLVYNNLVVYGGYNFHALNLSTGAHEWNFQDDLIHFMLYSSPVINDGAIYTGATMGFYKLEANTGKMVWENTESLYQNLTLSEPVYLNGTVYYATFAGKVYAFSANSGAIGWSLDFDSGLDNTPLLTNDRIYIGIQAMDAANNSVFCYKLSDRSLLWSAKVWQVTSNLAIADDFIYVVGGSSLYCLNASTGVEKWKYAMASGSIGEPLIYNGKVIVGNGDNLICLNSSTGELKWQYATSDRNGFSSPARDGDRIYVACGDGKIYCFEI